MHDDALEQDTPFAALNVGTGLCPGDCADASASAAETAPSAKTVAATTAPVSKREPDMTPPGACLRATYVTPQQLRALRIRRRNLSRTGSGWSRPARRSRPPSPTADRCGRRSTAVRRATE